MIEEISQNGFTVKCMDGAEGMLALPDKSIKLVYGSPPYPNAERDYGVWRAAEYIDKISPFIDAAKLKLRDDGFIVINVKANREIDEQQTRETLADALKKEYRLTRYSSFHTEIEPQ